MGIPYGGEVQLIGDLAVVPVFDGYSHEEPTELYVLNEDDEPALGYRSGDWARHRDMLDDGGKVGHSLGGFLVATGDHLTLIDCGVGPGQVGPFGPYNRVIRGGELPRSLQGLGVDPATITDVLLTHLHPDHYGWATADGGNLFPNAVIRCPLLDWEHFVVRSEPALGGRAASLAAIADRVETWDEDGPILPGIDARLAPGHTPGSTILVLSSGSARGVLLGDVVHCPVELVEDEWASLGDVDPALARKTKVALARELAGSGTPVVGAHFPGMRFGRLLPGEGRRQWVV